MYAEGPPVGLSKGLSSNPRELVAEVVVPYREDILPDLGAYLLIEMSSTEAAVGRVIQYHPAGPLASTQGENYLAEMSRDESKFPESIRDLVLRYLLRLVLLGVVIKRGNKLNFEVGARSLANYGMNIRYPSPEVLSFLANAGLDTDKESTVPFGSLALGHRILKETTVYFSIERLKNKRSFVFARAGYGKSNLIKYLLSKLYSSSADTGLLIFDPEGEYALPQKMEDRTIPGLADLPRLRDRMRYYTQRDEKDDIFKAVFSGGVRVNFGDFSSSDILNAFIPSDKHESGWANCLKALDEKEWRSLIKLLHTNGYRTSAEELTEHLRMPTETADKRSITAIIRNLVPAIARLHDPESKLVSELLVSLGDGGIIIVDISLLSGDDGMALASLLMQRVFYNNVSAISGSGGSRIIPTLLVMEEAQTTLGGKNLSENSIFVRWVKEGRKYQLGAIMITQQPGAIAQEILSQGDNFFVMHLLNQVDLDCLSRVNAHYAPDILEHIRNEPIKGNCYFWSAPDQPYVVSSKVYNFDDVVKDAENPTTELEGSKASNKNTPSAELANCCQKLVNCEKGLYVFKVKGREEYAVSHTYLLNHIKKKFRSVEKDDLEMCFKNLGWKNNLRAKLMPGRKPEQIVLFLEKHWLPSDGKAEYGEIEIE